MSQARLLYRFDTGKLLHLERPPLPRSCMPKRTLALHPGACKFCRTTVAQLCANSDISFSVCMQILGQACTLGMAGTSDLRLEVWAVHARSPGLHLQIYSIQC